MSSVTEKKDEIDLIRSVFTPEELIFDDPLLIDEFDFLASQNAQIEDKDVHLVLKIAFPEVRTLYVYKFILFALAFNWLLNLLLFSLFYYELLSCCILFFN